MLSLRRRRIPDQKGFTLIELAIALAILGILVAIAVPTYLGVRNKAYDAEAKQALGEIRAVAWSHYLEGATWDDLGASIERLGFKTNASGEYETQNWAYTLYEHATAADGAPLTLCAVGRAGSPAEGRSWALVLQNTGSADLTGPDASSICP